MDEFKIIQWGKGLNNYKQVMLCEIGGLMHLQKYRPISALAIRSD